jgi:prepilin-type N-terminal cleavage/methylation domain-containing protein
MKENLMSRFGIDASRSSTRHKMSRAASRPAFSLVELLVVMGIIALLVAILLPTLNVAREAGNKAKCASNLRQIGQQIIHYAIDNRGVMPRTIATDPPVAAPGNVDLTNSGFNANDPFFPTIGTAPVPDNVPAAIFLIMREKGMSAQVFICASSKATPDNFGGGAASAKDRANWTGAGAVVPAQLYLNLSYSYQNPYPDDQALQAGYKLQTHPRPDFVMMADMNPGIGGPGGDDVTLPTISSPQSVIRRANSWNHQRKGQNCLYADGHIQFEQTPFVGIQNDNIYTRSDGAGGNDMANPLMSPFGPNDSVLLPTDDN